MTKRLSLFFNFKNILISIFLNISNIEAEEELDMDKLKNFNIDI